LVMYFYISGFEDKILVQEIFKGQINILWCTTWLKLGVIIE
jgi:hypothetical protein